MNYQGNANLLFRWGDTLERAILAEADSDPQLKSSLLQVVDVYADLWARHILPRRNPIDLTRLDNLHSDWTSFAASHYTAFIKFHLTCCKVRTISQCGTDAQQGSINAELLLDLHDAIASFWQHCGAVIDNLAQCFDNCPVFNYKPGQGMQAIRSDYPLLDFAYNRRTQSIHFSIVPIGFDDGMLIFNKNDYATCETSWISKPANSELVDNYIESKWSDIVFQLFSVWKRLQSQLHDRDSNPPKAPEELYDEKYRMNDSCMFVGSGSGWNIVQSNSTRHSGNTSAPYWVSGTQANQPHFATYHQYYGSGMR
ncbi:MAG: hypothetical protein JNJ77_12430 [Planctomycetia bacterium]|nr:hypothetical protein [Planctomycetia bacterium]